MSRISYVGSYIALRISAHGKAGHFLDVYGELLNCPIAFITFLYSGGSCKARSCLTGMKTSTPPSAIHNWPSSWGATERRCPESGRSSFPKWEAKLHTFSASTAPTGVRVRFGGRAEAAASLHFQRRTGIETI